MFLCLPSFGTTLIKHLINNFIIQGNILLPFYLNSFTAMQKCLHLCLSWTPFLAVIQRRFTLQTHTRTNTHSHTHSHRHALSLPFHILHNMHLLRHTHSFSPSLTHTHPHSLSLCLSLSLSHTHTC